jgi:hypothetical protein
MNERTVGKFLLSELISFMRFDAMGPLAPHPLDGQTSTMNQAYLTRAVYVSIYGPDSTAQNREDPVAFASKMQSALGAGGSFLMKRTAIEIADFERDLRRLKDIPKDLRDFGRLFREFWDKDEDKQLGPSEMWEKTRNIRYQGVTFWKLPVLQLLHLPKGTTIGPGSYRFTGKLVPFLVGMVVLLRMNLRMELNRAYQRAAKGLGNIVVTTRRVMKSLMHCLLIQHLWTP